MIEYINGQLVEKTPTNCVVEAYGIGYDINISLNTYSYIENKTSILLYIYEAIREDAHQLFGFATKKERELFKHLISVSGIGPSVGRAVLSSMSPDELTEAIASGNSNLLKSVKGIGGKTAERIIVDLKDKIKLDKAVQSSSKISQGTENTATKEAIAALVMLGYNQKESEKAVNKVLAIDKTLRVDQIIKHALKMF